MRRLLCLDIDDTMMSSIAEIHCILPVNGKYDLKNIISLGTSEFAKRRSELDSKKAEWNFTEFSSRHETERAFKSISIREQQKAGLIANDGDSYKNYISTLAHGEPHKEFLDRITARLDNYDGVGLLTARGGSPEATYRGIITFLKTHGYNKLANMIDKNLVFCISHYRFLNGNSDTTNIASNTEDMKTIVMTKYYNKKFGYDLIDFYDDDVKNVNIVGNLDFVNAFLVE